MSADNYTLVRRAGDRWAVSDESDSAAEWAEPTGNTVRDLVAALNATAPVDSPHVRWYNSEDVALVAAHAEHSEYGVVGPDLLDHAGDTATARYHQLCDAMVGDPSTSSEIEMRQEMFGEDHEGGEVVLHLDGGVRVTVAAQNTEALNSYVAWLEATTPGRIADVFGYTGAPTRI